MLGGMNNTLPAFGTPSYEKSKCLYYESDNSQACDTPMTLSEDSWLGEYDGVCCEADLDKALPQSTLDYGLSCCSHDVPLASSEDSWLGEYDGVCCEADLDKALPQSTLDYKCSLGFLKKVTFPPDITEGLGQRKDKEDLNKLEEYCIAKLNFTVFDEVLYMFWDGRWVKLSDKDCRSYLRMLFKDHNLDSTLVTSDYNEIYKLLLCNPDIQRNSDFSPPAHCLNLADGTLDLRTMELRRHNPEDDFLHCHNLCYRDIQSVRYGNAFESFAERNSEVNPVFRTQLLELTMLALLGCNLKHFYVLLGQSNTGKSQYARFLMELVGRSNVATIAGIHDFANRFTISDVVDKLFCTCLDLSDSPLPSIAVGTIKQLVGDDPIKAEAKYKPGYTAYRKPLLLLCGNHRIQIPNISKEQALLNRMVVIPFGKPVAQEEQQQELYKLLLAEAPYIVSEAIEAYRDLMERNFEVTTADIPEVYSPQDSRESYQSVQYFVKNCLVLDSSKQEKTADMFERYNKLVARGEVSELKKVVFSRCLSEALKQFGDDVQPAKRIGDEEARGYSGIMLRPEHEPSF